MTQDPLFDVEPRIQNENHVAYYRPGEPIKVACPEVTDKCEMWSPCGECEPTDEDWGHDAFEEHGVKHVLNDDVGDFLIATGECYIAVALANENDEERLGELFGGVPGVYQVALDDEWGQPIVLDIIGGLNAV